MYKIIFRHGQNSWLSYPLLKLVQIFSDTVHKLYIVNSFLLVHWHQQTITLGGSLKTNRTRNNRNYELVLIPWLQKSTNISLSFYLQKLIPTKDTTRYYRIDSLLKSGDISWRCTLKTCKARLRTDGKS